MTASVEILDLEPAELKGHEARIQTWLEVAPPIDLEGTYPQLFRVEGGAKGYGVAIDGELRSNATVRRVDAVVDGATVPISLIGLVATDPAERGQRLASRLLQHVADIEQPAGREALLLWSERWDFYARLGFAPCGVQAEAVLDATAREPDPGVRLATASDVVALTELHARKPVRIDRDLAEMALVLSASNMVCVVLERANHILAYACCGKGLDFTGWWHELGGIDSELAVLLPSAMRMLGQTESTVLIPPYRSALATALGPSIRDLREGVAALCKPLSAAGVRDYFVDGLDSV